MLRENLERVRDRIASAAKRGGRDPAQVRLVCVTKGIPVERIQEAMAHGVREIGENRVQEAKEKQALLGTVPFGDSPFLRWHLIGHLQRNKAKFAVELFDVIHSVDSLELVETLDRQAGRRLEVLVQVNVSAEATKHGVKPDEARMLAEAVLRSNHLKLTGLMTLAPFSEDPEDARPFFRELRLLRDRLQKEFFQSAIDNPQSTLHLSMGMSQDFEVAVEEGATLVRVGTAIFGREKDEKELRPGTF